jgi:hypothetical protein
MQLKLILIKSVVLAALALETFRAATAQPPPWGGPNDRPPQPPQEAVDACDGKEEGSSCQFESPQGTITGNCQEIQQQPVCVPEGGPPGEPPGEPPESSSTGDEW